jgi:tetratricopeptide (TPR) repeat protein
MNDKDLALIDDYYNGLLSPEDAQALLRRAGSDTELAMEMSVREKMERWLKNQPERKALAENLETIGPEYFMEQAPVEQPVMTAKVNWRRRLMLAASVVVMCLAAWFLFAPKPSLYRQYAQYQPLHLSVRGAAEPIIAEAEAAFNAKDFPRALSALDRLLLIQPDNGSARLYKGICLLELNRPADARTVFAPIAEGQTALRADGIWYAALSYLLENDLESCKTALKKLETGDAHFEAAQAILKK